MVKTIIIFVIAALFFVVAGVFRQSLKKEQLAEKEYTEGVVTRKIYSGSGNARFYVLMDYGGMKEEFQTVSYSGGTEHINPGDHVRAILLPDGTRYCACGFGWRSGNTMQRIGTKDM